MPLSFSEFESLRKGIDLPPTTTNILYAQASVGMGGRAVVYRFNAPSEDCLRYAQRLASHSGGSSPTHTDTGTSLVKLTTRPTPLKAETLRAYGLESIDWFTINVITNGYCGPASPDGLGLTWVDTAAGAFYFWTD